MTKEKILQVIETYRKWFVNNGIPIIEYPHLRLITVNNLNQDRLSVLAHCHGMLDKMVVFVSENRTEKAMRWLGFIQGCLWATGKFPLEDLKNHSKPD